MWSFSPRPLPLVLVLPPRTVLTTYSPSVTCSPFLDAKSITVFTSGLPEMWPSIPSLCSAVDRAFDKRSAHILVTGLCGGCRLTHPTHTHHFPAVPLPLLLRPCTWAYLARVHVLCVSVNPVCGQRCVSENPCLLTETLSLCKPVCADRTPRVHEPVSANRQLTFVFVLCFVLV